MHRDFLDAGEEIVVLCFWNARRKGTSVCILHEVPRDGTSHVLLTQSVVAIT